MVKKILCIILAALTALAVSGCGGNSGSGNAPYSGTEISCDPITLGFREINKHGNIILDTSFKEMNEHGIGIGDMITVKIGEKEFDLPVGTSYTDVDSGEMICRFDLEDNEVALAINYGSFAGVTGAAVKQETDEDPGYRWDVNVDSITITLKEKNGYIDEYNARNLSRTDAREDYADLSDEEFANFRAVSVTGLKENTLYRSSTPIDPAIGRDTYAMEAAESHGIRAIINLNDSVETMKGYSSYDGSYYSKCAVVNVEMSYDFEGEEFGRKVKESVLFIIENDGPYLVHCKEGKDRTGILCAILECFAGATADEVKRDYMITYANFFNVNESDAAYSIILKNNLVKNLSFLFKTDGLDGADLKGCAYGYLLSVGLTEDQLGILNEKLVED